MDNKEILIPTEIEKQLEKNQAKTFLNVPIEIDTRMIKTIGQLNDAYFITFAQIHAQLETVPLVIYEKGIKASAKQYKRDLTQLKKKYKELVKLEKRAIKKQKRKSFWQKLRQKFQKKEK